METLLELDQKITLQAFKRLLAYMAATDTTVEKNLPPEGLMSIQTQVAYVSMNIENPADEIYKFEVVSMYDTEIIVTTRSMDGKTDLLVASAVLTPNRYNKRSMECDDFFKLIKGFAFEANVVEADYYNMAESERFAYDELQHQMEEHHHCCE